MVEVLVIILGSCDSGGVLADDGDGCGSCGDGSVGEGVVVGGGCCSWCWRGKIVVIEIL